MNTRAGFILLAIAAVTAFGATACEKAGVRAARENASDLTSQKVLWIDDRSFLLKAEEAEIRQTTLSKIALDNSNNDEIRQYARQVITNYRQALAGLTDLMKVKNVAQTSAVTEGIQLDALNRLHGLSGSAFDHEFVSLMTAEQQATVAVFNSAAETSADPDVRNYAKSVLPFLRQDFDTVTALQKRLAAKDLR